LMNWNVLGHEWAVNLLQDQVRRGQTRHAYLLTGPHGIGRRTLALRLAQALNCLQPPTPGAFCGVCRACVQIENMQHPDLAIVQAEQRGGTLKVEQVRELQRSLALSPYEARYRVALLLHFEEANASAANALLKTLEEPGPSVILILTAESAEILLETIVSRCELLRLRPLPVEQVSLGLQEIWGLPADQARLLAAISDGRPGYAVQLYQHPELRLQRTAWLEEHARLLAANRVERYRFADSMSREKDATRALLLVWLSCWRDVLLQVAGAASLPVNLDIGPEIVGMAKQINIDKARQVVAALERTIRLIDGNVNTRLALEVLMLDLPKIEMIS
jgi:DNA polymerase-3 subunit delta'